MKGTTILASTKPQQCESGILGLIAVLISNLMLVINSKEIDQEAAIMKAISIGLVGWVGFILLLAVAKVIDLLERLSAYKPESE